MRRLFRPAVPAVQDAPAAPPSNRPAEAQELVRLAFRAVLRREADAEAMAAYGAALEGGRDLAWLLGVLEASDEYRLIGLPPEPPPLFPLDRGARMVVDVACDGPALQALWDRVEATWRELGEVDPHWSVLTEDRYRAEAMDGAARQAFLDAGEGEVTRLEAWMARNGLRLPQEGLCVELGCGVGRITRGLARRFRLVRGLDVSAPHLAAAAAQMEADGLTNVELVQVRGQAELSALAGADLFYSVISLQHSPPPIIVDILRRAMAGLRPGGAAFFQVPTYNPAYRFPAPRPDEEMEMHFVPQSTVFELAGQAGLQVVEVQPDWCVGRPGEWISNTFLFVRPG